MIFDTITAIATPIGEGAIGIVRLSGPQAIQIANTIFKGKNLLNVESHTIHYGHLVHPMNQEIIDEVMVIVMKNPRTFTKEDVVEIHTHGGLRGVQRALELVLEQGVRLAEPGEFTKRAFINGRIDLSQAEAVIDIIRAKTDQSMSIALSQLEGNLSKKIKQLRQEILETLANVEVNIDYPEYDDVEEMTHQIIMPRALKVKTGIVNLLSTAKQGKIMREGVSTAIIGRPNVGKSSLLNRLLQENKAIVTNIPGTTRDIIEEYVNIKGVPLKLIDTAGIRETEDIVEKIGVERSKNAIEIADLILFVLNSNEEISSSDIRLLELVQYKPVIYVLNKTDLNNKIEMSLLKEYVRNQPLLSISILNDYGIEELEDAIIKYVFSEESQDKNDIYISNVRQIDLLKKSLSSIEDAIRGIEAGLPIDLIQIDFTQAWEFLGEIIGEQASDSLINELFSQFCLGK